jgi:hypothetical protein
MIVNISAIRAASSASKAVTGAAALSSSGSG